MLSHLPRVSEKSKVKAKNIHSWENSEEKREAWISRHTAEEFYSGHENWDNIKCCAQISRRVRPSFITWHKNWEGYNHPYSTDYGTVFEGIFKHEFWEWRIGTFFEASGIYFWHYFWGGTVACITICTVRFLDCLAQKPRVGNSFFLHKNWGQTVLWFLDTFFKT